MATSDAKNAAPAEGQKILPDINVAPTFNDDAQLVDTAIARLRKCAATGKTKSYTYRVGQLKQLMKGITTMAKDLS